MTRDEAVAAIKVQLGFRTNQDAQIVTCLQQAQVKLERMATKPWFLLSEKATVSLVIDEPRLAHPTDYLGEYEENGLTYIPADNEDPVALRKDDLDILKAYYKLTEGPPEAYAVDGAYFRIFPIPDDEYTMEMYYYQQDTVLSTNVENNWLKYFPFLIMGEAGILIAGGLRDTAAMSIFNSWRKEGMVELYRDNEARKHANTSPQIGGAH